MIAALSSHRGGSVMARGAGVRRVERGAGEVGQESDYLIFRPDDVDLARSPLRRSIAEATYVMGAFNPGFARLSNGNLLLMVRVAEALKEPVAGRCVRAIRWTPQGYVLDRHSLDSINMTDPRQFSLKHGTHRLVALTSLSWLLPVELTPDGREIVRVHYDQAIEPAAPYQEYGIEDARICRIDNLWYMTTCSVSAERHCTTLHVSHNGLDYELKGIVLDHQNKDMILFEGKVGTLLHGGFARRVLTSRRLRSCYSSEYRTPELVHPVEGLDGNCNFSRTTGIVA